jgi:hypothetical protein
MRKAKTILTAGLMLAVQAWGQIQPPAMPPQATGPAGEEDIAFFEKKYQKKITGVKPKSEYADPDAFYTAIGQQLGIPEISWKAVAKEYGWKKSDVSSIDTLLRGGPVAGAGQGSWDVLFMRSKIDPETKKPYPGSTRQMMVQMDYDGNTVVYWIVPEPRPGNKNLLYSKLKKAWFFMCSDFEKRTLSLTPYTGKMYNLSFNYPALANSSHTSHSLKIYGGNIAADYEVAGINIAKGVALPESGRLAVQAVIREKPSLICFSVRNLSLTRDTVLTVSRPQPRLTCTFAAGKMKVSQEFGKAGDVIYRNSNQRTRPLVEIFDAKAPDVVIAKGTLEYG